jgi:ketosteroid isomerase-like protein
MKAWLSFLATAIVCASAFAQQPPQDVKQKLDSLAAKVREAYVKNDAAAYAKAYTSDGILVTGAGKVLRGQQEIEQATRTTAQP